MGTKKAPEAKLASILLGSAGLLLERDREGRRKRKPSKLWMEVKDGKKPGRTALHKRGGGKKNRKDEGYATQGAQEEYSILLTKVIKLSVSKTLMG